MQVQSLFEILNADFYTGVPDSQLKALCNYLTLRYGQNCRHHVIAANEGNCTALAAGYHLATGKIPVVYLQNSGEGNIINPVASLDRIYRIPTLFIIGWRGEPGIHDEPQHLYQGQVTVRLLDDMEIPCFVIGKDTTEDAVKAQAAAWQPLLRAGKQAAFVVRKGALEFDGKVTYENNYPMRREEIIRRITAVSGTDPVVSTTGKASRELFEIRETCQQGHGYDFLTVGSMGHSSSIALGIALQRQDKKIWCIDGDGAALMHMGAMAVIGNAAPSNLVHIVINNEAHETVGGMPTAASGIDLPAIAKGCGYAYAARADSLQALEQELKKIKAANCLSFLEVKCAIGARADLGRPTTTPIQNKQAFMAQLQVP